MDFKVFGQQKRPTLLLIPGLGVSYEIFHPLIHLLEPHFYIVAAQVDGFTLGQYTQFTSIDDQATQIINYISREHNGNIHCAYGLSLGGKILSRVLECNQINIQHAIFDAAPLLPLPRWLVKPLSYFQCINVWTCYSWTSFWKWLFASHYFDILLDECKKVYPFGGSKAVIAGYHSVYTNKLCSLSHPNIHYWYGTREAFIARSQAKHLLTLCPNTHVEVFNNMNHGQLLIDHPEKIARRITRIAEGLHLDIRK
jgi:hypothetical protein